MSNGPLLEILLINIIMCPYFFDLTTFFIFGHKSLQFFCCNFGKFLPCFWFLEDMTWQFVFEIFGPNVAGMS